MLKYSQTMSALSVALGKCQSEILHATKNSINPHFKNRYADLEEIIDRVKLPLSKFELSCTQHPSFSESNVSLTTLITHSSGEWLESTSSAPVSKLDVQGVGAVITYLRRYSLQSIFMFASADDDGNSVSLLTNQQNIPVKSDTMKLANKSHNVTIG